MKRVLVSVDKPQLNQNPIAFRNALMDAGLSISGVHYGIAVVTGEIWEQDLAKLEAVPGVVYVELGGNDEAI